MCPELVLWDWNGTLLDDVDLCVDALNRLLAAYHYPQHYTKPQYREIFGFPVEDYYRRAGFDFEKDPFPVLAESYMQDYLPASAACPLAQGTRQALELFRQAGVRQVILSASRLPTLEWQVSERGIRPYFDCLLGLDDIYAKSKVAVGLDFLQREGFAPDRAVMIGDSLHDAEVARALGVHCVLQCSGHQSRGVLQTAGVPVRDNVLQAARYCLAEMP